jgi:hypothetical protein
MAWLIDGRKVGESVLHILYTVLRAIAHYISIGLRSIISVLRILYHSKYEKVPQVESNRRLIVCGNGPSLGKQLEENQEVFQANDVLCVNMFSTTEYFFKIKPRYYCMIDPGFFADPATITSDERKELDAVWAALERADWKMELILPRYFKKSRHLQERVRNLSINVRYLNMETFSGWGFLHEFFLKKQLCAPMAQTVLIAAVYYGLCRAYKEIVLLGAESNWFKELEVDENNQVYINDSHYYGENNRRLLMAAGGRTLSIAEGLESDARAFRQYMFLASYATKRKCAIYNATPNSMLDAFPRIEIEELN